MNNKFKWHQEASSYLTRAIIVEKSALFSLSLDSQKLVHNSCGWCLCVISFRGITFLVIFLYFVWIFFVFWARLRSGWIYRCALCTRTYIRTHFVDLLFCRFLAPKHVWTYHSFVFTILPNLWKCINNQVLEIKCGKQNSRKLVFYGHFVFLQYIYDMQMRASFFYICSFYVYEKL